MNEMLQAIQNGDLQQIDAFLETFLMNEAPGEQYEIAELLMHYGYLKEANRVLEHL